MKERLEELQAEGLTAITEAASLSALEEVRVSLLGRKGALTELLRSLGTVSAEERPLLGQATNAAKQVLSTALDERKAALEAVELCGASGGEAPDLTLPGRCPPRGHPHVIPQVADEIVDIFRELGFKVATGPDIETQYYNFDALNIPKEHPARDVHDTFFVSDDVVLRTHTSPVQMRVMEKTAPPVAVVAPGRVYRNDYDASHSPMFYQIEGLLVDQGVSFADLKGTLMLFVHKFFGPNTGLRFRPHYFPFTEPSAEMDISCKTCGGSGCRFCKNTGWVEVLGCGMVHPEVFRAAKYDYEIWTGYAFGMGIDRLASLRHGISSLNYIYENDLRFVEQF